MSTNARVADNGVKGGILRIFLINVRGLTEHKWREWGEMVERDGADIKVSMFTETQHKVERVNFGEDFRYEVAMRSEEDKKGEVL